MKTSIIQTSMKAFKWRKWCNTKSYERIIRTDDNKSVTADEVNSYRHGFESNPWTVPNHLSFKGCKSKRSYLDVTLWIPSLTESDFTLTKYIVAPSWLGLKSFSVKYYLRSGCNVCFKYLECSLRIDRTPRNVDCRILFWCLWGILGSVAEKMTNIGRHIFNNLSMLLPWYLSPIRY